MISTLGRPGPRGVLLPAMLTGQGCASSPPPKETPANAESSPPSFPPVAVMLTAQGCGYQDLHGQVILPARYAWCGSIGDLWYRSWVAVRASPTASFTFYDLMAGKALARQLDDAEWDQMSNEYIESELAGQHVLLRRDGTLLTLPKDLRMVSLVDGSPPLLEYDDGRWGYLNADGSVLQITGTDYASPFGQGRAAIHSAGHAWLIDAQGRRVNDLGAMPSVELVDDVRDDWGRFLESPLEDGWVGVPLTAGRRAVNPWGVTVEIADLRLGSGGMVPYQAPSGLWGFLRSSGDGRIEAAFAEVGNFLDGLAPVWPAPDRAYYIDTAGRPRIDGPFSSAQTFEDGLTFVVYLGEERYSVLTTSGEPLYRDRFESVFSTDSG